MQKYKFSNPVSIVEVSQSPLDKPDPRNPYTISTVFAGDSVKTTTPRERRTKLPPRPRLRRHNWRSSFTERISLAMARNSTNREQQYRAIMDKEGVREYKVLAFRFLSDYGPEYFHYELMLADPRPVYYLFDIMGEIAQVVVPPDEDNDRLIVRLAESCAGKKTTPILR